MRNILAKLSKDNDAVHYYNKALELNSSLTQARKKRDAALILLAKRGGDSGGGNIKWEW